MECISVAGKPLSQKTLSLIPRDVTVQLQQPLLDPTDHSWTVLGDKKFSFCLQ